MYIYICSKRIYMFFYLWKFMRYMYIRSLLMGHKKPLILHNIMASGDAKSKGISSRGIDVAVKERMTSSNGNISALLALCAGNSPVTVNSPHKRQWRGALMLPYTCAWINGWVNNGEAGDLRRHRAHYKYYYVTTKMFIYHQLSFRFCSFQYHVINEYDVMGTILK